MKITIIKQTVVNGKTARPGDTFDLAALSHRDAKILLATGKAARSPAAKAQTATAVPETETADASPKTGKDRRKA